MRSVLGLCAVVVALLGNASNVVGQEVRLIIAADTDDNKIGGTCVVDVTRFRQLVGKKCATFDVIQGNNLSRESLLRQIDTIPVNLNDSLVVIYTGHGAFDKNKGRHYLAMPRGPDLFRPEIKDHLMRRGCRLSVLITDCCSAFQAAKLPGTPEAAADPPGADAWNQLFLQAAGVVDINACSEGEIAGCSLATGGFFLNSMILGLSTNVQTLEAADWAKADGKLTWREFVPHLRKPTMATFSAAYPEGYRDTRVNGGVQHTQTPHAYQVPESSDDPPQRFVLGVDVKNFRKNGTLEGVIVVDVKPDSAASRCLAKDDVITEIDGNAIRSIYDFDSAIWFCRPITDKRGQAGEILIRYTRNEQVNLDTVQLRKRRQE